MIDFCIPLLSIFLWIYFADYGTLLYSYLLSLFLFSWSTCTSHLNNIHVIILISFCFGSETYITYRQYGYQSRISQNLSNCFSNDLYNLGMKSQFYFFSGMCQLFKGITISHKQKLHHLLLTEIIYLVIFVYFYDVHKLFCQSRVLIHVCHFFFAAP